MLSARVGQYFKWVGQSPEWVGHGLPGLGLEPPLVLVVWRSLYQNGFDGKFFLYKKERLVLNRITLHAHCCKSMRKGRTCVHGFIVNEKNVFKMFVNAFIWK